MKIIVCIKQVPGTTKVNVDPVTGTLIRDGVASKTNPYDLYAVEAALKLKEEKGGNVSVLSMGPPSALEVIREAIYMGADNGVLISDRKFGGADVLATSYTLCSGIKAIGDYDVILTGKQTTDGDTAQVGSELAEHLNIPHVTNVKEIYEDGDYIHYVSNLDNKVITGRILKPCLICMDGDVNTPRLPSYNRKKQFGDCKELIKTITFNDVLDKDESHYGLKGSPTQVERIFEPDKKQEKEVIDSGDVSKKTFDIIKNRKFI